MLPVFGVQADYEFDVFADQPVQHLLGLGDDRVEVDDARLHHLAAAEGQQLIGQGARPIGGFENLFGIAAQRVQGGELIENHPVVAGDYGEHVVEVVRHATGQAAHRLHLLRVQQLRFQGFAGGDVADEGDPEEAVVGFDGAEAHFDGKFGAVTAPSGEIEADSHGAGTRPVEIVVALAGVSASLGVGQEHFDPRTEQFLRGVAEHLGGTAIDQDNASAAIDTDDGLRCRFQESDQQLLVLVEDAGNIGRPGFVGRGVVGFVDHSFSPG